jgi:galactose mutarotase-like enzyme
MIVSLKNNYLSVSINTLGAELITLLKNGKNYIWQIDKNYWDKTSPVLFPIVGALKNDQYTYEGKTYSLPRHGFARNSNFEIEKATETQAIFLLESNTETLQNYPFQFQLYIAYTLQNEELVIEYLVKNTDTKTIYFSLGAHPAFALEEKIENYSLHFNQKETLEKYHLQDNLIHTKTSILGKETHNLPLHHDLFANDALVFKNLNSDTITLMKKDKKVISVQYDYFPFMGIWTKPNAPFLCIEPWCGMADNTNHNSVLQEKEGIESLPVAAHFLRAIRFITY